MSDDIIIVSGLPRSGTSMMMQMLEAGGVDVLTDGLRLPDEHNPKGYFEYERVKSLKRTGYWIEGEARGKAMKVISNLLKYLPRGRFIHLSYKIIFMLRDIDDVLASQGAMLGLRSEKQYDACLKAELEREVQRARKYVASRQGFSTLFVNYEDVVEYPILCASTVSDFIGGCLDVEAMAAAVDPSLRRQNRGRREGAG